MGEFLSNKRESALRVLSKSKLLAFRQCPKRLWLEVHRPDLREDSSATQASFTVGHQVGDIARQVYDPKGKAQDIFAYADQKMPKTGGAFTGGVSGVSPTSGSSDSLRVRVA